MSDKNKSSYLVENDKLSDKSTPKIYTYSGKFRNRREPELNSIYHDAVIYRKEDYGVFVNFNNDNSCALLHRSKMGKKSLHNLSIGDKISVCVIDIKERGKISVKIFEDEFPSLVSGSGNTNNCRWGNNIEKVFMPSNSAIKKKNMSGYVKCKYSGVMILEEKAYRCKESVDGDIYYFASLDDILRYNKERNRYLKLLDKDGKLQRVDIIMSVNKDRNNLNDVDIL